MDIQYPYATAQARLQLLYRLPTAPAPQRLLLVAADADAAALAQGWPGPVRVMAPAALLAAPASDGQRCDALALPGLLGRPAAVALRGGNLALLMAAERWLVPGGRVVGHLAQGRALRHLLRRGGLAQLLAAPFRPGAISGPGPCLRVLRQAGFSEPQCFYVQPSISAPMGLVPCEAAAARAHFVRAVRSQAAAYSAGAYAVRLALAQAGLGGLMQEHLFFWASKPC